MSGFGQLAGVVLFVAALVVLYGLEVYLINRSRRTRPSARRVETEVQSLLYPTRRERVSIPTRDVPAPLGTARDVTAEARDVHKHV